MINLNISMTNFFGHNPFLSRGGQKMLPSPKILVISKGGHPSYGDIPRKIAFRSHFLEARPLKIATSEKQFTELSFFKWPHL